MILTKTIKIRGKLHLFYFIKIYENNLEKVHLVLIYYIKLHSKYTCILMEIFRLFLIISHSHYNMYKLFF